MKNYVYIQIMRSIGPNESRSKYRNIDCFDTFEICSLGEGPLKVYTGLYMELQKEHLKAYEALQRAS